PQRLERSRLGLEKPWHRALPAPFEVYDVARRAPHARRRADAAAAHRGRCEGAGDAAEVIAQRGLDLGEDRGGDMHRSSGPRCFRRAIARCYYSERREVIILPLVVDTFVNDVPQRAGDACLRRRDSIMTMTSEGGPRKLLFLMGAYSPRLWGFSFVTLTALECQTG